MLFAVKIQIHLLLIRSHAMTLIQILNVTLYFHSTKCIVTVLLVFIFFSCVLSKWFSFSYNFPAIYILYYLFCYCMLRKKTLRYSVLYTKSINIVCAQQGNHTTVIVLVAVVDADITSKIVKQHRYTVLPI